MKQQYTVEVEIPNGFEIVDYRRAEKDEYRLLTRNQKPMAITWESVEKSESNYFILKKVWEWPKWLKANFLTYDADGVAWIWETKPDWDGTEWLPGKGTDYEKVELWSWAFQFDLPPRRSTPEENIWVNPKYREDDDEDL